MRFDDYELLVTLNETKTLRQAAEVLYISQPAVSQRLKSIEEQWSTQIFIRTKKELIVTSAGEKIIEHAKHVVDKETHLMDSINRNRSNIDGKVTIGVSSLIGYTIIPSVLEKFLKEYPMVNVQVQVGSTSKIVTNADKYHVSITRGNKVLNKENVLLFSDEHYLVAPKNKPIEEQPLIEFQADAWYSNQLKQFFEARFNRPYLPQIHVDQITTCRELLLNDVGMTVLPSLITKTMDLSNFHVEKVEIDGVALLRDTFISYDSRVLELPQVKSFIDLITEEYK